MYDFRQYDEVFALAMMYLWLSWNISSKTSEHLTRKQYLLSKSLSLLDKEKFRIVHEIVDEELQAIYKLIREMSLKEAQAQQNETESIWDRITIMKDGKTEVKPAWPWTHSLDENPILIDELWKLEEMNKKLSKDSEW